MIGRLVRALFVAIPLLCCAAAGAGAVLGCGASQGDDMVDPRASAQLDGGMRDYLKYTITGGEGAVIGQILVTSTAGRGFLADREY